MCFDFSASLSDAACRLCGGAGRPSGPSAALCGSTSGAPLCRTVTASGGGARGKETRTQRREPAPLRCSLEPWLLHALRGGAALQHHSLKFWLLHVLGRGDDFQQHGLEPWPLHVLPGGDDFQPWDLAPPVSSPPGPLSSPACKSHTACSAPSGGSVGPAVTP